jgi:hypothetical protein
MPNSSASVPTGVDSVYLPHILVPPSTFLREHLG